MSDAPLPILTREYSFDPGERIVELYITDRAGVLVCSAQVRGWEEPAVWLSEVVTHESYRRQGYARRIVQAARGMAWSQGKESVSLNVRADAEGAIALYRSCGFRIVVQHGGEPRMYMMSRPAADA